MSTTIYTGFKFAGDIRYLREIALAFRDREWRPAANAQIDRFIERGRNDWGQWLKARAEIKRTGLRNPEVDTDFELVLFPVTRRKLEVWLGLVLSENSTLIEKWLDQPQLERFGYWDNTDPEEGVTPAEWNKRRQLWGKALIDKPGAVPAMWGFAFSVADPMGPFPASMRRC